MRCLTIVVSALRAPTDDSLFATCTVGSRNITGVEGMLSTAPDFQPSQVACTLLLAQLALALACHADDEVLPQAPSDVQVRVVARFEPGDHEPVRIAAHPASGRLYVLGGGGDVSLIDVETGSKRLVLAGADYIENPRRQYMNIPLPVDASQVNSPITLRATLCLGLAFDRRGRLYVVANV